nr:MFS transporter [Saccharolobus caldissimus]
MIMTSINLSILIISSVYSIINLIYITLSFPIGLLVDKLGSKNVLVISALLAIPSFLLMSIHNVLLFIISFIFLNQ